MATKTNTRAGVVTERSAHAALRGAPARDLSPEEEKVVRMRVGASPPRAAPLERSYEEGSDLEIEIRAAEIEAWMKAKAHAAARRPAVIATPSRVKEKIVRALRRKS